MFDSSVSSQDPLDERPKTSHTGLKLGLVAGLLACVLAASYLARTSLVLGPAVSSHLGQLAQRHGVDLKVKAMRPLGLSGLRLEQVQLVARHGSYLLEGEFEAVDVTPDLGELLGERRLHPKDVAVEGGRILVIRQPSAKARPSPDEPDADDSPAEPRADQRPAPPATEPEALSTRTILRDVSVSIRPAPLPGSTRPLTLHRAEFMLTRGGQENAVDFRYGYGVLPDGVGFAMRRAGAPASQDQQVFLLEPQRPTRVDRWFEARAPLGLSVERVRICPQCEPATVDMEGLDVLASPTRSARLEEMTLQASHRELRASAPEVLLEADNKLLPYSMQNLEGVYDTGARTAIVQGDVFDDNFGRTSFAAHWSGQWGVLETHLQMRDFDTGVLWEQLGVDHRIGEGRWTGEMETSWEPAMDLAEATVDLKTDGLDLDLPIVTRDALVFGKLGLNLDAIVQPRARTVSISTGQAQLGEAGPIRFAGYATNAPGTYSQGGWVFDVQAAARGLDPQKLLDGLPPAIARVARGTSFEGDFGFGISSAGHTSYPEGIVLSVDFSGDVDVHGDNSYADVLSLAADGPPSIELPGTLSRRVDAKGWVNYDELPAYVPRVLTAAEDAQFFSHDGFDWGGLRRALVHNVRAGRIKRGGSTLSQQLSKNLFLDPQRTLVRKVQEAYVTWRLESELSKTRILELYMNLVDFGPNVQGLDDAAERYFGIRADELTLEQITLLASVLPGPSIFGKQVLSGYLPSSRLEKIEHILANLRFLGDITLAEYYEIYGAAEDGEVGGLKLTICDDDGKGPEGAPSCS
ncbi:MAG: biosynthetic peptidoglycan transglycosylase [Persicimonas sp.]